MSPADTLGDPMMIATLCWAGRTEVSLRKQIDGFTRRHYNLERYGTPQEAHEESL